MSHDHSQHHHHEHSPKLEHVGKSLIIGIVLNSVFVIIEATVGWLQGSLSLLTDAGHNLSDVASLALALLAFKLAKKESNKRYTYGYKRSTILVSLINAVVLLAAVVIIVWEAILRFKNPHQLQGFTIAWVALAGIGINAFSAWLFMKDKDRDLNIKGAYLHMAVDALVSLGVVISGVLIYFTHWYILDSIVSLIIAVVIVTGTWSLLKHSVILEMDGVPAEMNLEKVKQEILQSPDVIGVHHVHVWALSTTENALTAHVVIDQAKAVSFDAIKSDLRHRLEHLNISHCTFEPEFREERCLQTNC